MNMKTITLFKRIVKEKLKNNEISYNVLICEPRKGNKIGMFDFPIDSIKAKNLFINFTSSIMETGKYKSFMQVCLVSYGKNKEEGLMFYYRDDTGKKILKLVPIWRNGAKIKFGKIRMFDNTTKDIILGKLSKMWE